MQQDSLLAGVTEIVAGAIKMAPSRIVSTSRLREEFGLDSLAMIDLAVALEDRFGVRIPDEDAERFQTVGDMVAFLRNR